MNKSLLYALILLIVSFASAQEIKPREVLRGRVVADTIEVENITVYNKNTYMGAITDADGKFSIRAKANDTLVFQALTFISQHYVLKESDFLIENFKIKLEAKVNYLNEIVVSPNSLTGIVEIDAKRIKTYSLDMSKIDFSKLSPDDVRSTKLVNPLASEGMSPLSGVNFIGIFQMFVSKKKKEERRLRDLENYNDKLWNREVMSESFYEHLFKKHTYSFFVNDLKIAKDDIPLFVAFADPGTSEMARLLKPENELELLDYLVKKADEFNRNKKVETDTNTIDEQKN